MVGRRQGSGSGIRGFAQKVTYRFLDIANAHSPIANVSNSHVQSAKAIFEDIAHLCWVPGDWRLPISDRAAWPFPTFWAKTGSGVRGAMHSRSFPLCNPLFCPTKRRFNSRLRHFMDQAGEIVTHDLCQRLIDHRNIRSGAQTVAEFPLHHGELRHSREVTHLYSPRLTHQQEN